MYKNRWDRKRSRTLKGSEAYEDNPVEAQKLWDGGYRPMPANELKPGMRVMVRQFLLHDGGGPLTHSTLIGDVMDDDMGTITVSTFDFGNAEVDELEEVWASAGQV